MRSGSEASPPARPIPKLVYVLGGLGIVTGAVSTGFGISAWNQKSTLEECRPDCANGRVDNMQRAFFFADLGAAIAVSSLVVAGILYLYR